MTKPIFPIITATCIALLSLTGCTSSSEKVKNAQENVTKAKEDLSEANVAYLNDVKAYKLEIAAKIEANNKLITEYKLRPEYQKKDTPSDYQKRIAELEQKNIDLKKRMDNYNGDGKDKWELFKKELSHDMDGLGQAIKDFGTNNK
jgi:hypothetical protein